MSMVDPTKVVIKVEELRDRTDDLPVTWELETVAHNDTIELGLVIAVDTRDGKNICVADPKMVSRVDTLDSIEEDLRRQFFQKGVL